MTTDDALDLDLWLFNTEDTHNEIVLWCLDSKGTHYSIQLEEQRTSFCVLTPDDETRTRLLHAVRSPPLENNTALTI